MLMVKSMRVALVACLCAALVVGVCTAGALAKVSARFSHPCCAGDNQKASVPEGGPKICCVLLPPSSVTDLVLQKSGFVGCPLVGTPSCPLARHGFAVEPLSEVVWRFLTEVVLSIRAPPSA